MIGTNEYTTGQLALVFGLSLLAANTASASAAHLDKKAARELAVISRILEKRLSTIRGAVNPTARAVVVPHGSDVQLVPTSADEA
jgi:hypothetical protein